MSIVISSVNDSLEILLKFTRDLLGSVLPHPATTALGFGIRPFGGGCAKFSIPYSL